MRWLPRCLVRFPDLSNEHVEHGVPRLFLVLELLHHLRALFYPHLLVRRLVHVELRQLVPQAVERVQQQDARDDDADQYRPEQVARGVLADCRKVPANAREL